MRDTFLFILIFVLSLGSVSFSQEEASFKIVLSKEEVKVGQAFEYKINIEIESQESPALELPEFKDFQTISQITSQSMSYKENKAVLKLQLNYILLALKEGCFTLPGVLLKYKDKTITSPSKEVRVSGVLPEFREKKESEETEELLEGATSI